MATDKKNDKKALEFARHDERYQEAASGAVHSQVKPKGDRMGVGDLLTDEELAQLRKDAANLVRVEEQDKLKKKKLEQFMKEARAEYAPEEELRRILIDLPGHSSLIRINETEYHHNHVYDVSLSLYRCLNEILYRAWQHEDVVGGVNRDKYIKPARNMTLTPVHLDTPNASLLRV
jgi:hypothetical protein